MYILKLNINMLKIVLKVIIYFNNLLDDPISFYFAIRRRKITLVKVLIDYIF